MSNPPRYCVIRITERGENSFRVWDSLHEVYLPGTLTEKESAEKLATHMNRRK